MIPACDRQREEKSASHCFLLSGWAGRSVRLPDSCSTALCTNLLQPNKTRYQRMTRSTGLPGILLLLLLVFLLIFFFFSLFASSLWSKRISEFHCSSFAAMLEAR